MSILVDASILTEPLATKPNERVLQWLRLQPDISLYVCSVTMAQVYAAIEPTLRPRRRVSLQAILRDRVFALFDGRCLNFDDKASEEFSAVLIDARSAGNHLAMFDAMTAAVARSHRMTLATSRSAAFRGIGLRIVDPLL
ncbi:MAG: PIN domain-containing protein [Casimicrobium sp.]